jgi:hypothetical protein
VLLERLRPKQDAVSVAATNYGTYFRRSRGLKITSKEGVMTWRESILDIDPDVLDLLVKARIKPKDINFVHEHSFAVIRLTPFRQSITPAIKGKVTYISAEQLKD